MFTLCLNNQDKKLQQRFIPDYLTYFGVQLVIISDERPSGFLHAWQDHIIFCWANQNVMAQNMSTRV